MIKKSVSSLLVLVLLVGNVVTASAFTGLEKPVREKNDSYDISFKDSDKQYKSSDKVRILVELKEKPAIDYASKKGVKFSNLSKSTKDQLHKKAVKSQEDVKSEIDSENVEITYINNFTTVLNGFSAEVKYGSISLIEKMDNVTQVHIINEYKRPTEKPEMKYSKELVQAQEAWREYDYKGEGMVIGIIDTGVDPSHRDMTLSETTEEELTEAEVNSTITGNKLSGKFYTEKVPFGYNYMDKNEEIRDLGSSATMHGMHVAGTAAANGNEESDGIKGVAPEAQVLALKVFGNDPEFGSTYGDIYVKAIDDAILLGADVLNLSLGSTAGFVNADDPEQQAVKRATENGVMMAISAGNSAHFGNGFAPANPLTTNPDIGVSGSPGVSYNSLQVASIENAALDLDAATFTDIGKTTKAPFLSASSVHPSTLEKKEFELFDAGFGQVKDFAGKDLSGKFALISRGEISFVEKTQNAQNAGAIGAIIYNNANGFINMATDATITIPQLSMLQTDGAAIVKALQENPSLKLSFEGDQTKAPNPEKGKMSSFSSWGLTPNLDFKPEITAPGGNIYSTFNDNTYGLMSGTSMAAPHVAGGSSLVLQRVDKDFQLDGYNRVLITKNILMNTASPVIDKSFVNDALGWEIPYSPRRQGGGIMQLSSALLTPVVVTEKNTKEAKVALKEVGDQFSFTLQAQNFSNQEVTYDVKANIQTDFANTGQLGFNSHELEAQVLEGATIKIDDDDTTKITILPNQTVEFSIEMDVSNAQVLRDDLKTLVNANEVFPNGYFVEGFVTLTEESDTYPTLNVPYVGFKGDWNKAPIVDGLAGSDEAYYGITGLLNSDFEYLGYDGFTKGIDTENVGFSPDGDNVNDTTVPVLSFLRNAIKAEYNILDSAGKEIRKLRTERNITKSYFDGDERDQYSLRTERVWDGKVDNEVVTEGDYFYEVKATLDYPNTEAHSFKIPVKVDLTKPTIEASYNEGKILVDAMDGTGTGVASIEVIVDGKKVDTIPPTLKEYTLPAPLTDKQNLVVAAIDFAGNEAQKTLKTDGNNQVADIHVVSPEALSTHNKKEIPLIGRVSAKSGIQTLNIAGKEVKVKYNSQTNSYEFNTTISFEKDGVHEFIISGTAGNGEKISIARTVIIDTTSPTLKVIGAPSTVGKSEANPKVSLKIDDNFDALRVSVNGNEVFAQEFKEPFEMRPFSKTIENVELKLKEGDNKFTIMAVDDAGNEVVQEVMIKKLDKDNPVPPVNPGNPDPGNPNPAESQGVITIDGSKATLLVDESKVQKDITDTGKSTLNLDLSSAAKEGKVTNFYTELNVSVVKKLVENKKTLSVTIGNANIEIPLKVLEELAKKATGKITIAIGEEDAKTNADGSFTTKVYDFKITYENNGETNTLSVFSEPVKVQLSLKGSKIKDARKVAAYHFNDKAENWDYSGGKVKGDDLVFAVNHFSKFAGIEKNKTFKDIKTYWAKDEVEVLASRSITSGKTTDLYAPNESLTRAQFAVLLVKALNIPIQEYEGVFPDVTEKQAWSVLQIEAANRVGIVKGSIDGKFNPGVSITREQMAAMIFRAIEYKDKSLLKEVDTNHKYIDEASISEFAKDPVAQITELGIMKGKANNQFAPKSNTTRGETAVILYRLLHSLNEM